MTSTALQVHAEEPRAVAAPSGEVDYGALLRLAEELVPTGFLPDHIKTPGQAVAIILTGRELGMAPMRAIRSLTMVKGKVTESADSQLARFKSDGGRAVFRELDETRAVLWLRHPNGDEHTETFTLEDARKAGLLANNQWQKFPKAMLRSRAITAGLKSVGWEGGTGTYDPDELAAVTPPPAVEAPRAAREDRRPITDAQRATFAQLLADPRIPRETRERIEPRVSGLSEANAETWITRLREIIARDATPAEPTRPVQEATYETDAVADAEVVDDDQTDCLTDDELAAARAPARRRRDALREG